MEAVLFASYHIHSRPGLNSVDLPRRSSACRIFTNPTQLVRHSLLVAKEFVGLYDQYRVPEIPLQSGDNREKSVQDGGQSWGWRMFRDAYLLVAK
jgi:hypothetical protein